MSKQRYDGVCIDYGHGEDTPGKRYRFTDHDDFECREYMTNRITAARLIKLLLESGRRVYDIVADKEWKLEDVQAADWCWHKLEQSDVGLSARVAVANKRPSWLVVSTHSNAIGYQNVGESLSARGACFYTSPGQTASDEVSEALHWAFVKAFEGEPVHVRRGEMKDGDHDYEANFFILRKTRGSAVLGEVLFFVNYEDARYLMSAHGQAVIAQAYYDGVAPFVRLA